MAVRYVVRYKLRRSHRLVVEPLDDGYTLESLGNLVNAAVETAGVVRLVKADKSVIELDLSEKNLVSLAVLEE